MQILSRFGSQANFARACRKSDDWLSRIITGRKDPSDEEKQLITGVLGTAPGGYLFESWDER
ncbi:MAG: helix-turn-helix transcriptional regulator [Thermodesulfobacteriota bacterium]|nr:helix-turn-helix transcriptional regulator [Thermodesulfobacteriota bacterium]